MDKKSQNQIYGVLGYPAKHSLSPAMHNAAFQALKINAEYRIFEVKPEELEDFLLKKIFDEGIAGFNITIPHKVRAREILEKAFPPDFNSPQILDSLHYVKISGAINTVKRNGNKLDYWNTDASGFLKSLCEDLKFDPKGKNILIIGCGGAGRAIISSLTWVNVGVKKIYINDIKEEAVHSAKDYFSQFPYMQDKLDFILSKDISAIVKSCDLLINATPVGMKEDVSVIDKSLMHEKLSIYDIVYRKDGETRLIKDAKAKKLRTESGLSLLLWQGVDAFGLWTGQKAPIEIMRKALEEGVKKI